MNLVQQVRDTLKWKKSDYYCASKLGIPVEKYKEIKRAVQFLQVPTVSSQPRVMEFKEDLDKGIGEIKGFSTTEPRTPEEIIELLKIDTTKWKLSSYWNKERHDGWQISAMVTTIKKESKDILAEVLKSFKPEYQPVREVHLNKNFDRDCIGVLSIQDLHFGKEDNSLIVEEFENAIITLVSRSYMAHKMDKIIYVVGGDLLNMDTFSGTTTSGTPLDNDQKAHDAYTTAFDALYWSINYIKQFCTTLEVVYIPGNHDRLSSYHMAHALSKCFPTKDIVFNVDYSERKVVVYGHNFFAFEHGDVTKKNTPVVYATEFAKQWGSTLYRTCYTGHFHTKKTTEYVTENEHTGFSIKHLPSLCSTDYWHYHNKFIGSKRQAIMEVHDKESGKVSEFTYTAQTFKV
jgi:UDP-2,3-diacylglucosamine pyrophosphatase LpxH